MQWTDERRTYLFNARRRKRTTAEIAVTMSDWYCEEITEADLDALWDNMISTGWEKKKRAQINAGKRKKHPFSGEDPAAEKRRLMNASILHLLDLKRAGHSPKRTEYKITPEGHGVRYRIADTSSYIGSSAGMCAEVV